MAKATAAVSRSRARSRARSRVRSSASVEAVPESKLLSPEDVERDYTIPQNTQAIWRCTNRYGFGDLVIKLGRGVRYRRSDFERWLESRRTTALAAE
jgi:hypothetical protein